MRLAGAAAADPPSTVRSPLSAAQRCAADALVLVFGFMDLKELAGTARACKAWLAAAAKEKPRGLRLWHIRRAAGRSLRQLLATQETHF
jgi:hypothetical protein